MYKFDFSPLVAELCLGRTIGFFVLVAAILLLLPLQIPAQWSSNPNVNNAICTASGNQSSPQIVSDGSGGAIITWQDARTDAGDIYAQRIISSGTVQWAANGVAVCSAAGEQYNPTIVSDGSGGAIITWQDARTDAGDIYAQRINSSGAVQWTANGVAICTATNTQQSPTIVSDGSGGAIMTWKDARTDAGDIYAQRINSSGSVQWTANGVPICDTTGEQALPIIASDGSGGAIITWMDFRSVSNFHIYVQRINSSGGVQWTANGLAICTATGDQYNPTIVSDDSGGAIITWYDYRSGNWDIYAQRINSIATVQWTANGVAICTATNSQANPTIVGDGSGGAVITWNDYRSGSNWDIYAQRINSSGAVQWTANGVAICTATNTQQYPTMASDGSGGAIITWYDYRSGNWDIYAQRINSIATVQWTANGVAVCTASGTQQSPTIVSDGSGGAIITWMDSRSGNWDIYAQLVNPFGYLVTLPFSIGSISDIPNDQGGKVRISWTRLVYDSLGSPVQIVSYGVWRRIPTSQSGLSKRGTPVPLNDTLGVLYDFVTSVPAVQSPKYNVVVPTLEDSSYDRTHWTRFVLTVHTNVPTIFEISNEDSGYSVDNIAPDPPSWVSGSVVSGQVDLRWKKNTEPDLWKYYVYRSSSPITHCDKSTYLLDVSDTAFTDTNPLKTSMSYYVVCAEDIHGNPSNPSNQVSFTPSDFSLAVTLTSFTAEAADYGVSLKWKTGSEVDNAGFTVLRQGENETSFKEISSYKTNSALRGLGTSTQGQSYTFTDNTVMTTGKYTYQLESVTISGRVDKYMEVTVDVSMPKDFTLCQNYPNPFNPTTTIGYALPTARHVKIEVTNTVGQVVGVLVDEDESAGYKTTVFDGSNRSSGVYFYMIQAGSFTQVKKMLLVK